MRKNEYEGGGGLGRDANARAVPDRTLPDGWIDAGHLLGEGVGLFFTDRSGGVSPPPHATLNLSYRTGDAAENVRANRRRVASLMGVDAKDFVYLEQVHGVAVKRAAVRDDDDMSPDPGDAYAATDGVYTTEPGLVLAVLTADCVPLALYLPSAGMVAMLHAGWRGTIGDIAGRALRTIAAETGCGVSDARAVMGPAIGRCCYEVDEGRARLFVERYGGESGVVTEGDGYHLDLFKANMINLREAGLDEANVERSGGCTCCERRYYSFRRDGETGRQGAFVLLPEKELTDTG